MRVKRIAILLVLTLLLLTAARDQNFSLAKVYYEDNKSKKSAGEIAEIGELIKSFAFRVTM